MKTPALPSGWGFVGNTAAFFNNGKTAGFPQTPSTFNVATTQAFAPAPDSKPVDHAAVLESVDGETHSLWLPLGGDTPVAAFRSGAAIVFVATGKHMLVPDETAAIPWRSFARGNTTIVQIAWPKERTLSVSPTSREGVDGWQISDDTADIDNAAITPQQNGAAIVFPIMENNVTASRHSIEIADPSSGRRMLLGLVSHRNWHVSKGTSGPGYEIRPSLVGVVVDADADTIELRPLLSGFALDAVGADTVPVELPHADPVAMSPGLLLSSASLEILRENYRRAWTAAAEAPPAHRFGARVQAARAALALGDVINASAILDVALQDDPEGIERPAAAALRRAVSTMRGQYPGIEDTADDNGPEAQLWRGLASRLTQEAPAVDDAARTRTASLLAAGVPVVADYPAPLCHALSALIAEWIARYGDAAARATLVQLPSSPDLKLAQAIATARTAPQDALATLKRLTHDTDPLRAAKAQEAYLAAAGITKTMSPKEIAAALDRLRPSARLAGREAPVLLAQTRAEIEAGQWHAAQDAIATLHHLAPTWSSQIDDVSSALIDRMNDAGRHISDMMPERAAALITATQNATQNLPPDDPRCAMLNRTLADEFKSLSLPQREIGALQDVLASTHENERRPEVVQRLAGVMLSVRQAKNALSLLQHENPDADPPTPVRLLEARAMIATGDTTSAKAVLNGVVSDDALTLRTDMAETALEWSEAVATLQQMKIFNVPPLGALSRPEQQLVLRLCADAARAGDQSLLARIQHDDSERITDTDLHQMLGLLTASLPTHPTALSQR